MPPRRLVLAFVALWWTVGLALLYLSLRTVHDAVAGGAHDPHVALLGGLEAVAAVLFLIPRTLRVGAAGLLAAIAVAFVIHAAALHQFRADLLLDAGAVAFVAIHGPVRRELLASGRRAAG
jgi:hypothetical protein